jgi:propionyl-CoA carboxylase beta chain
MSQVPQLAIMATVHGGAVYSPAITDFILMVENTTSMFVTGPNVVKTVTHEEVNQRRVGGASTHFSRVASPIFSCTNEVVAITRVKCY